MGKKPVMTGRSPRTTPQPKPSRTRKTAVATRATHDESSKTACLVEQGPAGEDLLEVDYSGSVPRIRLVTAGILLSEGELRGQLTVDDHTYDLSGQWDWCCFHGDEDGSYLELELGLTEHLKVERQFFLGRNQHRLVCGETVVAGRPCELIQQDTVWPSASGVKLSEDRPTREVRLKAKGAAARLFPMHLPQDRMESTSGSVQVEGATVQRSHRGTGHGLFAAMSIDWHPERGKALAQWRTLTVTEEGRKLSRDQAAAYRVRLGTEQWLVYRQIHRSAAARCVLGYHTRYESVVGRVLENGEIKELLQIE